MNDDLVQRLLFAESDFLAALESGSQMLTSYNQTWSALPDTFDTAMKTGSVNNETLYPAHSAASRIANLASCLLDIRRREESLTALLQKDWDTILHGMATLDLNANPDHKNNTCSSSYSSTPILNAENSSPAFLASAHQWLMDNLHNPYPPAEVKAQIAATSACQVSSINSWFANARRRIGWTTLCRERFSNRRAEMIDAAHRALVEEDPQRVLSPELRHSFVAIRVAAEGLYPSTLIRSAFGDDLDAIVKDTTEEDRVSGVGECSRVNKEILTKVVQDSYPSPNPSIATPPVPALVDSLTDESEEDEEEDVAPRVIAGSKRRRSSIEPDGQPCPVAGRPTKRLCAPVTSRTCLLSPPSSTDGIDEPLNCNSPELSSATSALPELNKVLPSPECLSNADTSGIPKYLGDSMSASSLHIVSDPLPRNMESEYSIDDWFNTNFGALFAIPPPVDVTEPDLSASWEVELFKDYSIPVNTKYAPKCAPTHSHISASSDLSSFDSLLHSIDDDTCVTSVDNVAPCDVTGHPYMTSFDLSIPLISQTNADCIACFNTTETYQPTIYSTFSQYPSDLQPLPEIDLSVLQLPHVTPTVNSQGDSASKQAKLLRLHTMQEAVRRMEQELRSEGVVV